MLNLITSELFANNPSVKGKEAMLLALSKVGFEQDTKFYVGIGLINWYEAKQNNSDIELIKTYKKSEVDGDIRVPLFSARTIKNGYDFLLNSSLDENTIYFKPMFLKDDLGTKGYQYSYTIVAERDDGSIQEQYDMWIEFFKKSGLMPSMMVYTGGKSIHVYFAFTEKIDSDTKHLLTAKLTAMVEGDTKMDCTTQATRLPGVQRVITKDENDNPLIKPIVRDIVIIHETDAKYSITEIEAGLEKAWQYPEEFSKERYTIYKSVRTQLANKKKKGDFSDYCGLETATEVFELPAKELQKTLATECKATVKSAKGNGDSSNPFVKILQNECIESLDKMSIQQRYELSTYNFNFKKVGDKLRGKNPFSLTNHSEMGSLCVSLNNGLFYDFATERAGSAIQMLMFVWYNDTNLRGKTFVDFVKRLCDTLGLDWKALYDKYNVPSYMVDGEEALKKLVKKAKKNNSEVPTEGSAVYLDKGSESGSETELEDSEEETEEEAITFAENVTLIEPESIRGKKYLGVVIGSVETATEIANNQNIFVLAVSGFREAAKKAIENFILEKGFKPTIRVFVQDQQFVNPIGMMWFKLISDFCKGLELGCKFLLKNCLKVDVSSKDFFAFEKVENAYYQVKTRKENQKEYERVNSLSYEPDVTLNCRYLVERVTDENGKITLKSNVPFPGAGKLLVVSAPMGTGKTEYLAWLVKNFPGKVCMIGYLNNLLRQSCERISGKLWLDQISENGKEEFNINTEKRIALCINSLMKLSLDRFDGSLLLFDEIEAIINVLVIGDLLKDNRGEIQGKLKAIVQRVLSTNGSIVCLEADITDLTFKFLIENLEILAEKITFVKNEFKHPQTYLKVCDGELSGLWGNIIADLRAGKRVVFPTDSQAKGEALEMEVLRQLPNVKVLRVDSSTNRKEETSQTVKEFLSSPNVYLERNEVQLLIYSPSLESGGDIKAGFFDIMYFHFSLLPTRNLLQLLGRVRDASLPRIGLVGDGITGDLTNRSFKAELILDDWLKNAADSEKMVVSTVLRNPNLEEELGDYVKIGNVINGKDIESLNWLKTAAEFKVRNNISTSDSRNYLIKALKERGDNVELGTFAKNAELKTAQKEHIEVIDYTKAENISTASTEGMTEREASKILSSNSAKESLVNAALKFTLEKQLQGLDITPEFLSIMYVKRNQKWLKAAKLFWQVNNLEIAKQSEIDSVKQITRFNTVSLHDIKSSHQVADIIARSGVIRALDESDTYHSKMTEIKAVADFCRLHQKNIKRILGITVTPKSRDFDLFKKLAEKVGIRFERDSYRMVEGKQTYIYRIRKDELYSYHCQVQEALDRKYAKVLENVLLSSVEQLSIIQSDLGTDVAAMYYSAVYTPQKSSTYPANPPTKATNRTKSGFEYRTFEELTPDEQWKVFNCGKAVDEALENNSAEPLRSLSIMFSQEIRQIVFSEKLDALERAKVRALMAA